MLRVFRCFAVMPLVFSLYSCGGGGGSGTGNVPPPSDSPQPVNGGSGPVAGVLQEFAGNIRGAIGSADGTGGAASFNRPEGIATDAAGNVYVADSFNATIRKITPSGDVTTIAGSAGRSGSTDGNGASARFGLTKGVATDASGNVYVVDTNYAIRKITPSGDVTTLAGSANVVGSADGTGGAASFNGTYGVATDASGNLYVADTFNSVIRKVTPAGVVTTFAGTAGVFGFANGTGAGASFNSPYAVAVDPSGNVYVADTMSSIIRKITPTGTVSTFAGTALATGSVDGIGAAARFNRPKGIATDASGNVYVADTGNSTIRKISPAGVVTTLAGTANVAGSTDGNGASASFDGPYGIASDSSGNIYVADALSTVRKITPAGDVTTLAGTAPVTGSADGNGLAATFNAPAGITSDAAGNFYVADSVNSVIRKITPSGVVTTLAGTPGVIGSTDGTGAAAAFNQPMGIASDGAGNVYVSDYGNCTIRKITPAGGVTTLAGAPGVAGSTDGSGGSATFNGPMGIATDSTGNVYVADSLNATLRKITPAGVVTTLAGVAGTATTFSNPYGVATDTLGNVYVSDFGNWSIFKVTPTGVVTVVPYSLSYPTGIATDTSDNVYVAQPFSSTIQKISPVMEVTTVNFPGAQFDAGPTPKWIVKVGNSIYLTMRNGVGLIPNIP